MKVEFWTKVNLSLVLGSEILIVTSFHTSRSGRGVSAVWLLSLSDLERCTLISVWNSLENYCEKNCEDKYFNWNTCLNIAATLRLKSLYVLWWPGGYQKLWLQTTTEMEDIKISPARKRKSLFPVISSGTQDDATFISPAQSSKCVPEAKPVGMCSEFCTSPVTCYLHWNWEENCSVHLQIFFYCL